MTSGDPFTLLSEPCFPIPVCQRTSRGRVPRAGHSPSAVTSPRQQRHCQAPARPYSFSTQHRRTGKEDFSSYGSRDLIFFSSHPVTVNFSPGLQKDSHTKIKQSVCYPRELQSAFHRQTVPKSCLQLFISKAGGFCTLLAAEPGAIWAWALPRGSTATSASQCSSQMKNFGGCCGNGWKSRRTIAEPKHTNSRPYENFDHVHFWQDIFSGGLTGKKEP